MEHSGAEALQIAELKKSGAGFGTSGVRGLVTELTDRVCYAYTKAFLQHLQKQGELSGSGEIGIGGDLRPSTDRIMAAVASAASSMGYTPISLGKIASPAIAYYGIGHQIPTVMVTGSHIPADRNGIKFNKASGEISKLDEEGITAQSVGIPSGLFDENGMFLKKPPSLSARNEGWEQYKSRYLDFFSSDFLHGKRIGVYQHSAVIRDVMVEIYEALGAQVTPLARSETFVPVDTEAIRDEDVRLAKEWVKDDHFDCIVSADGDSDRPLISDEAGNWLRGDVAGILCGAYLRADSVSTPVSCNTAVEKCGYFKTVRRTKIGSPFVIASMEDARSSGAKCIVGYEANGGFLLASDIERNGKTLKALPTRDAMILQISIMGLSKEKGRTVGELLSDLPQRFTFSDRLQEFPTEKSKAILGHLASEDPAEEHRKIEAAFGKLSGKAVSVDKTDGVRATFDSDEIIHLRPSGNAPEFRCYTEADTPARAEELNHQVMEILKDWKV